MALRDMTLSVLINAKDQITGKLREVDGKMQGLEQHLRTSAGETADFNRQWEQTIHLTQTAGMVMTAAGAAIGAALGKATQAALYQEEVENKLRHLYPENADALIEYAAALQKTTRFGDEHIISAMQIGATYPRLRAEIEQATETALNMSEAYGMDLVQAMHLLGKASAGQYGMLSRYGILIDKNRVKAEGMAEVYRAIDEETKGLAFTTDAASKSVDQMKNALGDTAESVGMALLPAIKDLTPRIIELAERAGEFAESPLGQTAIQWAAGLGMVMVAVGPVLALAASWGTVTTAATAAWVAMTGPVGLVVAGVVALGAAIYGVATAADRARDAVGDQMRELEHGALTSEQALDAMRLKVADLVAEFENVGNAADGAADSITDMRAAYEGDLATEEERIAERVLRLQEQRNIAVQEYGRESRQALEAELRLLEEQEKLLLIRRELLGPEVGWALIKDEDMEAIRQAQQELERSFAALEAERKRVQDGLAALSAEEGELSAVTRELGGDTDALSDAQKRGEQAASDYSRAQRDAARDVDDARRRIEDAEQGIADAVEDKAKRVEDASRRVADAQRSLADAYESAAERIQSAEERAARSMESAEDRVVSIRRRLAELDAPELTPAQRKERQRMELLQELAEAEAEVQEARKQGEEDVAKAQVDAQRMVEDAARRVQDAYRAQADTVEAADKRIADAQERKADAEEQYARTVERAGERVEKAREKLLEQAEKHQAQEREINADRVRSIDEVTAAYQRQAWAQERTQQQPVYRPTSGAGGGGSPRYAPNAQAPAAASAGASGGGGRQDIYLHLERGLIVDTARGNAGSIVSSPGGRQAVVHIVRDEQIRR